ncbi:energy-coupling factor ABC transporter permease [Alteromonas sp. H39]|uniref:energy-coupling factor ABC transporter permease n=1 Tax=Alteromonas sp. H39 TaxID=3389876 RepID=UPI0039E00F64
MFETLTFLQLTALIVLAAILLFVGRHVSFAALKESKSRQHVVFGATALTFFMWVFRAGIFQGLDVHFLWLTALTLILGFRYALFAGLVALLGITSIGHESWQMFGVNGLIGVVMPVCVSYLIYLLSFHKIPRHLFVYIFVCAFFPGAIVIALKLAFLGSYYAIDGIYSWDTVVDNYMLLIPLILFPEGFINGVTMTLLVVYKPEWVYTFHDKFYLDPGSK